MFCWWTKEPTAEAKEKQQYENMVKRIVAMYESGNSSAMQIIFESGSIAQMLQNMNNVQSIHEYDRAQLEQYVQVKEEIDHLESISASLVSSQILSSKPTSICSSLG